MADERAQDGAAALLDALTALRTSLTGLRLPLELPGVAADRRSVEQLVDQLDNHLLPRVRQLGAPLLAVVGGSTGAGKSTLVNSLLGTEVTAAGVIRPTTRSPVLVHHPDDAAWFLSERILPRLPRVTGVDAEGRALRLVAHPAVPRGLALLDAPDIDSVVVENRRLGEELLGAADLWVFVTTAARYADAVPWDLLDAAAHRSTLIAMVLNRVDAPARDAVTSDLGRMLEAHGLPDTALLVVPEERLTDGLLPKGAVGELSDWLHGVAADEASRAQVVRRAVRGAVGDVVSRLSGIADAADAQVVHVERLRAVATQAYGDAGLALDSATSDGTMLRGEVLARWQEYVGTGEVLRAIESKVSTWRDRLSAIVRGRPAPEPVAAAISSGLVDMVLDAADRAADRTYGAWSADPAGEHLVDGLRLSRSSTDLRARITEQIRAWQEGVLELVTAEGGDRRATARALSLGVNGAGAALMVAIFSSTGGLTGTEVGVAGGSAVLAQRLLEAVFGDDAVRRLTKTAQQDLTARLRSVLDVEAARFSAVLDALDLGPSVSSQPGDRVREAAREVEQRLHDVPELAEAPDVIGVPGSGRAAAGARGSGGAAASRGHGRSADAGRAPGEDGFRASEKAGAAELGGFRGWWQRLWGAP